MHRGGAGHGRHRQLPGRLHRAACGAVLGGPCLPACFWGYPCPYKTSLRVPFPSRASGVSFPPTSPLQGLPAACTAAVSDLLTPAAGGINVTDGLLWVNAQCEASFMLPLGSQPQGEGQQEPVQHEAGELTGGPHSQAPIALQPIQKASGGSGAALLAHAQSVAALHRNGIHVAELRLNCRCRQLGGRRGGASVGSGAAFRAGRDRGE